MFHNKIWCIYFFKLFNLLRENIDKDGARNEITCFIHDRMNVRIYGRSPKYRKGYTGKKKRPVIRKIPLHWRGGATARLQR